MTEFSCRCPCIASGQIHQRAWLKPAGLAKSTNLVEGSHILPVQCNSMPGYLQRIPEEDLKKGKHNSVLHMLLSDWEKKSQARQLRLIQLISNNLDKTLDNPSGPKRLLQYTRAPDTIACCMLCGSHSTQLTVYSIPMDIRIVLWSLTLS